jgi:hypothetical protein
MMAGASVPSRAGRDHLSVVRGVDADVVAPAASSATPPIPPSAAPPTWHETVLGAFELLKDQCPRRTGFTGDQLWQVVTKNWIPLCGARKMQENSRSSLLRALFSGEVHRVFAVCGREAHAVLWMRCDAAEAVPARQLPPRKRPRAAPSGVAADGARAVNAAASAVGAAASNEEEAGDIPAQVASKSAAAAADVGEAAEAGGVGVSDDDDPGDDCLAPPPGPATPAAPCAARSAPPRWVESTMGAFELLKRQHPGRTSFTLDEVWQVVQENWRALCASRGRHRAARGYVRRALLTGMAMEVGGRQKGRAFVPCDGSFNPGTNFCGALWTLSKAVDTVRPERMPVRERADSGGAAIGRVRPASALTPTPGGAQGGRNLAFLRSGAGVESQVDAANGGGCDPHVAAGAGPSEEIGAAVRAAGPAEGDVGGGEGDEDASETDEEGLLAAESVILFAAGDKEPSWLDSTRAAWVRLARREPRREEFTQSEICNFIEAYWEVICWPNVMSRNWRSHVRTELASGRFASGDNVFARGRQCPANSWTLAMWKDGVGERRSKGARRRDLDAVSAARLWAEPDDPVAEPPRAGPRPCGGEDKRRNAAPGREPPGRSRRARVSTGPVRRPVVRVTGKRLGGPPTRPPLGEAMDGAERRPVRGRTTRLSRRLRSDNPGGKAEDTVGGAAGGDQLDQAGVLLPPTASGASSETRPDSLRPAKRQRSARNDAAIKGSAAVVEVRPERTLSVISAPFAFTYDAIPLYAESLGPETLARYKAALQRFIASEAHAVYQAKLVDCDGKALFVLLDEAVASFTNAVYEGEPGEGGWQMCSNLTGALMHRNLRLEEAMLKMSSASLVAWRAILDRG